MKKHIAFFDFDGTITDSDTMIEIIRYHSGSFRLYIGILKLSPYLLGLKLGLVNRKKAKELFLSSFFSGISIETFNKICQEFSNNIIPKLVRPEAYKKILWHKEKNHKIVVVTASPIAWVGYWCKTQNIECIGTELEIFENKITGKIIGNNCHGEEKLIRINNNFNLNEYEEIFVYGDSEGDKQMMSLGTNSFYKPFRKGF